MDKIIAYHFTGDKLRNGQPIPAIGEVLTHTGPVVPCESGLHASEHPFDALQYAPGPILHRVELWGNIQTHGNPIDKLVGRNRVILASIDATNLCRHFARLCALDVIHLWDAPPIVKEYLETGNENIRYAAGDAAWYARYAAGAAGDARYAAWAAARAAARDARYAAGAAGAAWAAAQDAAWAAARAAAQDAARAAAQDAARAAARAAAQAAARDAQRDRFLQMVNNALEIGGNNV